MENATKIDYSQIAVSYDKTDVDAALRGNKPREGWTKMTVTNASSEVSKNKGSMMFMLEASKLDAEGNTSGKPIRNYLVLPIATPRALLTAAGFPESFTHTPPNTSGLVRAYLEATRPTEFPHELTFVKDEKQWYLQGEAISKAQADEIKATSAHKVLDLVTKAWSDPAKVFIGDTFYGKVFYQEGRDFPSIGSIRGELPEGETLA